ncbi:MAG: hypothetical protein HY360_21790 [Verrucomicrobia bacterium]|nr:hypothetical protein [Verrucomicrobiota bacterium]
MKTSLRLQNINRPKATVGLCSLPISRAQTESGFALDSISAQSVTLGVWPETAHLPMPAPRRNLVLMLSEQFLPETLEGCFCAAQQTTSLASHRWRLEIKEIESIKINASGFNRYYKDVDELVLRHGDRALGFRMGVCQSNPKSEIRNQNFYWWQWVTIDRLWDGPVAAAYRIGGLIYAGRDDRAWVQSQTDAKQFRKITNKILTANAFVILFSNGVAQVHARHINTRLFNDGEDIDGTPVFAFTAGDAPLADTDQALPNADEVFAIAPGVRLNLRESLTMCSRDFPGRLSTKEIPGLLVYRPFLDPRVAATTVPSSPDTVGAAIQWEKDSTEKILRGVARTTRFTVSLSNAAPEVARFVPPAWWYAHCEESGVGPFLPVRGALNPHVERVANALLENQVAGHFCDGAIWREVNATGTRAWSLDADEAGSLLRYACERQDGRTYSAAMRAMYFAADVATDHASWTVHLTGNWGMMALPHHRFGGLIHGYLETGDDYLKETAEAMAASYMALGRFNWPMRAVGRDAEPAGGLAAMWRYTGDRHFLREAHEVARTVAMVQEAAGSFVAQRGVGPCHGANNLPGGPWMAGHAMNAVTEALIVLGGDEAGLLRAFDRWAMWIVPEWKKTPHRGSTGMAARQLSYLAHAKNDPVFLRDLFANLNLWVAREDFLKGYHHAYFFVANVPFAETMTLRARWMEEEGALEISPLLPRDEYEATVLTPRGPVKVAFRNHEVKFTAAEDFPVQVCWQAQTRKVSSQGAVRF